MVYNVQRTAIDELCQYAHLHRFRVTGPDWAYGEQDGGPDQVGHVLHVSRDRSVLVRWPNGRLQNYRYNCGGLYDVVISDADDPLGMEAYTTKMNKRNMQRCTAQPDLCLTVAAGGRD
ncbi:MIB1-like protein [Mya arenaria]|uniref:MIB1-like protein n=1 Tax=Mya arenaria TaxID=6604 RepID=A0ABY7DXP1_MYAAR|nr:MIB1-like protein [Mya arenaria]